MSLLFGGIVVCSIVGFEVTALSCNDVNPQACQLLAASKPDLCDDLAVAMTTCPRFCGKCALECYHCDEAVRNVTDCNTTQACNEGEHCDGADIEFPFIGRRGLESRDLSVKCCELDLCNYPSVQVASTIPSGSTMQPTSASTMQTRSTFTSTSTTPPAKRSCLKDVILIVDESLTMLSYQTDILNFLASLVGDLDVSMQGTHVSMATYALTASNQFELNQYHNIQDLQAAIRRVQFRGGIDSISSGLSYILQKATSPSHGDRANVPDAVVLITEHSAGRFLAKIYEQSLHRKVHDVIAIGISGHTTTQGLQQIATDSGHVLLVKDPSDMSQYQSQTAKLICN